MTTSMPMWFPLDNAAKIYPSFVSKRDPATFRVAVILKEMVDPYVLKQALSEVIYSFPSMKVSMKKGLFWYYFERNDNIPIVEKEMTIPCKKIDAYNNNGYLFKVMYYNKRISVEFFHALTDGYGGFEFLKALVNVYLVKKYNLILEVEKPSTDIEMIEDSFHRYYDPRKSVQGRMNDVRAYKMKGRLLPYGGVGVTHGRVNTSELKHVSNANGGTITTYLLSILALTILEMDPFITRPIVLNIPVNLRKVFPSKSLRNFTYFINIIIEPKTDWTLLSLIDEIKIQMEKGLDTDHLYAQMHHNVALERKWWMRLTPNILKDFILKQARYFKSKRAVTTIVSNPGVIDVHPKIDEYIEHFEFFLYAASPQNYNFGICSFNDHLVISVSKSVHEQTFIQSFFKNLSDYSMLDVEVYSNDVGEENERK